MSPIVKYGGGGLLLFVGLLAMIAAVQNAGTERGTQLPPGMHREPPAPSRPVEAPTPKARPFSIDCEVDGAAFAEVEIQSRLKSPDDATIESVALARTNSACLIRSEVHARNSFNAMLRTYYCTIVDFRDGEGTARAPVECNTESAIARARRKLK